MGRIPPTACVTQRGYESFLSQKSSKSTFKPSHETVTRNERRRVRSVREGVREGVARFGERARKSPRPVPRAREWMNRLGVGARAPSQSWCPNSKLRDKRRLSTPPTTHRPGRALSPGRAGESGEGSFIDVTFVDAWTGESRTTRCDVGENLLSAATRCGAVKLDDEYCLEGRCGSCAMEAAPSDDEGDGVDLILGCRTTVEGSWSSNRKFLVGCASGPRFGDDTTWVRG